MTCIAQLMAIEFEGKGVTLFAGVWGRVEGKRLVMLVTVLLDPKNERHFHVNAHKNKKSHILNLILWASWHMDWKFKGKRLANKYVFSIMLPL